jgi:predicted transcriptional regulator YheO
LPKPYKKNEGAAQIIISGSIENFLENLSLVVEGIASTFGRNCEVVLHDLRHPERSIAAISNAHVTKRKVGGPIIGGPVDDKGLRQLLDKANSESVISNYTSRTSDNRPLKSTTMIFRKKNGKPVIALCINFDLTEIINAKKLLENISAINLKENESEGQTAKPNNHNKDIAAIMEDIIKDALQKMKQPFKQAEKAERLLALKNMQDRGLFLMRGGIDFAARQLEVSRFTIYNYLKEVRYL